MFEQFTKLAGVTAAELVGQSRKTALAAISFVPHDETKKALTQVVDLQCNFADLYAAQIDKMITPLKKGWSFPA